jgi:hypothetical protein
MVPKNERGINRACNVGISANRILFFIQRVAQNEYRTPNHARRVTGVECPMSKGIPKYKQGTRNWECRLGSLFVTVIQSSTP